MFKIRLSIRKQNLCFPPAARDHPSLETWQDAIGRDYGLGFQNGSEYWLKVHHVGTFVVQPGYSEVVGFPEEGVSLAFFKEIFFHGVAPWLLQRQDWDCLHGSAVLVDEAVVAFCGPSGCGKSTLACAWTERGAQPYADDAVPFLERNGAVLAARLPQQLRLRGPARSRFPGFPPATGSDGNAGSSREVFHDLEPTLRPLRSIYWPEPKSCESPVAVIERIPAVQAFPLLLSEAHTMSVRDANCNRKMVRNYLRLVQSVPVFRLSYASGLDLLPAVVDCLERNSVEP